MNLVEARVNGAGTQVEDLAFSVNKTHFPPCGGKEGGNRLDGFVDSGKISSFSSVKQEVSSATDKDGHGGGQAPYNLYGVVG